MSAQNTDLYSCKMSSNVSFNSASFIGSFRSQSCPSISSYGSISTSSMVHLFFSSCLNFSILCLYAICGSTALCIIASVDPIRASLVALQDLCSTDLQVYDCRSVFMVTCGMDLRVKECTPSSVLLKGTPCPS